MWACHILLNKMESDFEPPKPVITSKTVANILPLTGWCVSIQSYVCSSSLHVVHGETHLLIPVLQKRLQSRLSALQRDVSWRCVCEHVRVCDFVCTLTCSVFVRNCGRPAVCDGRSQVTNKNLPSTPYAAE